jgi:hypothetical protein
MILLITSLAKANDFAQALKDATKEPVVIASSCSEAIGQLQSHEFSAVVFDQLLLDSDPDEGRSILKHQGTAAPLYVNLAISTPARVARELRWAVQRRQRELATAKHEAERALRNELNNSVAALLLSCEMALEVPDLPLLAASRIHDVASLARKMTTRLGTAS